MLKFLMEERPNDRYAEIDAQIASGLSKLSEALEWNYYENGFVEDSELFHAAAARLMEHRRQIPRGVGARMVRFVPKENFYKVARQLNHILKNDDPAYHTYHNARFAMQPAVQIFGDHNILEGVDYFTDFILNGNTRWSHTIRMMTDSLPKYGIHAQPVLPKLREHKNIKNMYLQAEINDGEHRFVPLFEDMVKKIENATDGPPLVPLEEYIELSKKAGAQTKS
jgi:hypothetical protein